MADVKTIALVVREPAWRDELLIRDQPELGGHLTFMVSLVQDGVLEMAGPFFQTRVAGTIAYEVLPWYR